MASRIKTIQCGEAAKLDSPGYIQLSKSYPFVDDRFILSVIFYSISFFCSLWITSTDRPPKRGQPGHRTVWSIEVPGSRTWGRGGQGGPAHKRPPPYRPYLWVIILTHLAQQQLQSQTAPRPIPHAPSGQHRRHMGGSHPTSRMSTSSQSRGPTAPRGMNAFSVLFDFHMNV